MDKIIAHNMECKRTGNMTDYFDTEEVFGTLNVISLASNDTSHNSAMLNLCMLAEKKELRDIVTRISDELYDSHGQTTPQKIESHQLLSRYFKEAMRLGNAAPGTFARVALKDVKILDVNIRKGDAICIFMLRLISTLMSSRIQRSSILIDSRLRERRNTQDTKYQFSVLVREFALGDTWVN